MKWSVVGLVLLGVLAAISAAVLVAALCADAWRPPPTPTPNIKIVVAARTLPPMTILDSTMLMTDSKPRDKVPTNALTDITQAAGKVLAVQVASGQALTRDVFVPEGGGAELAAQLADHKRGMEISVQDAAGLVGKLYPGCTVDVLVAIRKQAAGEEAPETISRPLLQRVRVIAVDQQTVVATEPPKKDDAVMRQPLHKVMLDVNERQAQMLQLAQEVGTLYLLLRNPTDTAPADLTPVTLQTLFRPNFAPATAPATAPTTLAANVVPPTTVAAAPPAAPSTQPAKAPPVWTITVIQGGKTETQTFPLSGGK